MSSNWRNRPRPIEQSVEQVSCITGDPGKSAEDETATARLGVATKRGNARGAKEPCCTRCLGQREAGVRGTDGVTFEVIEAEGVESFLGQLQEELVQRCYRPQRPRKVGIPKEGGKIRQLSIPSIRDRVVQGALKLILEPIFEADFQPGSYGYRPKKSAHAAVQRVSEAI